MSILKSLHGMVQRYHCCRHLLRYLFLLLLLHTGVWAFAQTPVQDIHKDTVVKKGSSLLKTAIQKADSSIRTRKINIPVVPPLSFKNRFKADLADPFKNKTGPQPSLRIHGGSVNYMLNFRSLIDTPYAERDIVQHNITGRLNVTVAGIVPLHINYWVRQSNSTFFNNIYDVQLGFSGRELQEKIRSDMRGKLLALEPGLKDSLLEKAYQLKQLILKDLTGTLQNKFSPQKLIEANEVLKVPKLSWDISLPDSMNIKREDSIKQRARNFLEQYAQTKEKYDRLSQEVNSLKTKYQQNLEKIRQFRQLVNGKWDDLQFARALKAKLQEYGVNEQQVPAKYKWLLGVRNFSLGRSPVNYSELTAKNISVNGINVEYNSWYYLAFTAGAVNYRFRDFAVSSLPKKPQYLLMARAGIGTLEKNFFILSAFRGQKQLFSNGSSITINGLSAQTRWAVNRTTWLTAEIAKSLAPDFRNNPAQGNSKLSFSDKDNQAIAFNLVSSLPATRTRVEASFKKTGANYQSFSSYTTNTATESWSVKADQSLFKRKLRLAGSLRKNEFTNPFVLQDYKSNAVFKSITATLQLRKWPVVSLGYQPMSQLTKVDDQVIENRFQTFTATAYHFYTIKQLRLATTCMFNKFYNSSADSGFIYYNATNSYISQTFFFNSFTAGVGASFTKNGTYNLQVLDGNIQPNIPGLGTVGLGIKINNLNHTTIKAGAYASATVRIFKQDVISVGYEHGYLPGNAGNLVRNEMGTVQFIKTFNFR